MTIVYTSLPLVESYSRAVRLVARERKYLASTEGFSVEATRGFVQAIINDHAAQYFAVEDGEVIGWCDVLPRNYEGMQHVGVLGMGVVPPYRGKGIGGQLLQTTLQHAQAMSRIEKVELEVFESNRTAVRFYEAAGFLPEGKRLNARKLDGIIDHIILMGKFL